MNLRENMSGRCRRVRRSARLRSTRNRILFAALVVIGLTSAYLWVWNVRNRHLHKAALLISEATSVITSDASADWVWSVKTNLLSNSDRGQWAMFLKERCRPIVMERKSVEYERFVFLKSDGAILFSIHIMKQPLIVVRMDDSAYEFECIGCE